MKAIIEIRKKGMVAVSKRISEVTGISQNTLSKLLNNYWDRGFISKKTTMKRRKKAVLGCTWHYTLAAAGKQEYQDLRVRFE